MKMGCRKRVFEFENNSFESPIRNIPSKGLTDGAKDLELPLISSILSRLIAGHAAETTALHTLQGG